MITVNFATREYKSGQERLARSLYGASIFYTKYPQIGSPTHQESPYEFKLHAIEKAMQYDDIILWCDSSLWLVGDLKKIETIILEKGYFLEEAGHYVGRWCNQHARDYFNLTQEEAKQGPGGITMFSAGLVGLNRNSEVAMEFLRQWKASALAGCFRGDWSEHRHDMTCGSIIASRLNMTYQRGGKHLSYIGPGYNTPERGSVFHLQGLL